VKGSAVSGSNCGKTWRVPKPAPQLQRELGLRDITLFAITCIVGTRWIAAAAHAGPGSVALWILGALFFVIPLAITVAALIVKHPGCGGLYLWARNDFGAWHGFLCFWVYWMGLAFWFPSAALFYMSAALHAVGLPDSRPWLLATAILAIWIALGTNLVGMKIGKWTENIGGASAWLVSGLFVLLAGVVWFQRGSATRINIVPSLRWDTVNFWATIAYAMSGLELAGIMCGEVHDPERTFPRAGWIASGAITVFYASATIALLVLLRPDQINEMNGLAQAGDEAARLLHFQWLAPLVAFLVVGSGMGQLGGIGTAISRLPFAAGTDHLLPAAFSRIHPRWGTPHYSILALGVVASFLLTAIQIGDSLRAAYQELISLMVIVGFLPYLYIFGSAWKAGKRFSALSGWAITVLAIVCSVVPTAEITNVWLFEGKLAAGTLAVIGSAYLVYRRRGL
jgi:amino acid transporter